MLPTRHRQVCQSLLDALHQLRDTADRAEEVEPAALAAELQSIHSRWQETVLPLPDDDLDAAIASRWLSVRTEVHRNLRLLQTEVTFLQAARQSATASQRLSTIRDRLQQTISLLEILLAED